ncbi:hypothetical protein C8R46DRAFT_1278593, partial [Mycena filopes]
YSRNSVGSCPRSLFFVKLSSSIVRSFVLQLFLVDLVLAHALQFVSIMIPTQAGLRNLFPRGTSDPGLTPSGFMPVPTQTGLPNSLPGEGPADSGTSLLASSSVSLLTVSPFPTVAPSPAFPAWSTTTIFPPPAESTLPSPNNTNTPSASQPRTQGAVIIGSIIVGLALLGGLAAVLFLLRRRSLSKRHNLTTFPLDTEAALPPSPSQKRGGIGVGYAHPAAATPQPGQSAISEESDSDLARKVAELAAQGRKMQEELAALGRGQNQSSEVESATTTTDHAVTHGRLTRLDSILAGRARERDRKPVDRLPSYRQFDSVFV